MDGNQVKIIKANVTPVGTGLVTLVLWGEDITGKNVVWSAKGIELKNVKLCCKLFSDQETMQQLRTSAKDLALA